MIDIWLRHPGKHRLAGLFAAGLLTSLAGSTIPAAAGQPSAPAVYNVSNTPGFAEGEETVSANPRNAQDVVVGSNQWQPPLTDNTGNIGVGPDGVTSCAVFDSHDGGRTWHGRRLGTTGFGAVTLPTPQVGPAFHEFNDLGNLISADQNTVWDNHGNLYYQCIYSGLHSGDPQVWVFRSSDQGRTWSDPVVAFDEVNTQVQIDRSFLAVDNSGGPRDGTLYLTFETMFYQPALTAVYVRSTRNGNWQDWGPAGEARRVDDPSKTAQWDPRQYPVVGPDGVLHVAYDAATMVTPCPCDPQAPPPALVVASSSDGGLTQPFSHSTVDDAVARISSQDEAYSYFQELISAFAVDPADGRRMAVAWPDGGTGEDRIMMRVTGDGGATWSPRIDLADDPPGSGNAHDHVALAYLADGTLVAAWRDRRFTGGSLTSPFDVFLRTGKPAGTAMALGPSLRLTPSSQPPTTGHRGSMPSEYIGIAGDASGAHVSWDQLGPDGVLPDNFYSHVSAASLPPAAPSVSAPGQPVTPATSTLPPLALLLLAALGLLAGGLLSLRSSWMDPRRVHQRHRGG